MPWIASQTKMRCKLGIQRIRQLIEKNESLAKRSRREVASLLEQGKIETARIRTESLILSDQHNELLELLELYLELILARFGLLEMATKEKEPDEGVREAVCAVVYAAPRCEVRELHIIREAFMSRYGRDWAVGVMDNQDDVVSSRVLSKCKTTTPSKDLVDLYLVEISKAYGLTWRPDGWIELSDDATTRPEPLTAAQEQRLLEAELVQDGGGDGEQESSRVSKGSIGGGVDDGKGSSGNGGGGSGLALPETPSTAPTLNDVRNSTTSIPIIRRDSANTQDVQSDASGGLPETPEIDPAQSARTVVIKTMSPPSKAAHLPTKPASSGVAAGTPSKTASNGDSKYDDLAKRFEALKRK